MLARRVEAVQESVTLGLTAKAKALKAEGRDIVAFTAGELDFDPPMCVAEGIRAALARGETRYTPTAGTPQLRKLVAARVSETAGSKYSDAQVLVSCGAKHSIANLFQVLLNPGDEVVIPAPYWLSYPEMAKLAEAVPVFVDGPQERGFKPDPAALRAALTERSRLLVITSPSNPTGAVFTREELRAIADVVKDYPHLYILSDEIYDRLTYGGVTAPSFAAVAPELRDRVIVVNGVSKTYAMTGLRIGWAVGPRDVIDAATRLQSHTTSGPCSLAQAGAVAALEHGNDALKGYLTALERRRKILIDGVAKIPGFDMVAPDGAFYGFPSIARLIGKRLLGRDVHTAYDLAQGLLEHAGVVLVPGEPFGAPQHVRLAFALGEEEIARGLAKVAAALAGAL